MSENSFQTPLEMLPTDSDSSGGIGMSRDEIVS